MAKLIKGPGESYGLLLSKTEAEALYISLGAQRGGASKHRTAAGDVFNAIEMDFRHLSPCNVYFKEAPVWKEKK